MVGSLEHEIYKVGILEKYKYVFAFSCAQLPLRAGKDVALG